MMIYVLRGARVFAPEDLGICDILISGQSILAVASQISIEGDQVQHIDASGKIAVPGLVDTLVHFAGGGGEGGYHTRTPQMSLSDATSAGVTTVIGALGTDSVTRTLPDLIAKARGLENEGLTTFCYTGSYQVPAKTITGDITDDIILIDKMIGIGEVAIADHRSSQPSVRELARIASQARVGGMLAGKAGIVSVHVGDGEECLSKLHEVVQNTDIPATQFYPTHINRNPQLFEAGLLWCQAGGLIDFTTSTNDQFISGGEIPAAKAAAMAIKAGIGVGQMTMSSDGNASLPVFDNQGQLVGLEVGKVSSLHQSFVELVKNHDIPVEQAIQLVSSTPAKILKLSHKGRLAQGCDADVVLLDHSTLDVETVFAKGQLMVNGGQVVKKGTFE